MSDKGFHQLARKSTLFLLIVFLGLSTAGLVYLQYQQVRSFRGNAIPLSQDSPGATTTGINPTNQGGESTNMTGTNQPISFQLSEGQAQPQEYVPVPQTAGESLPEADLAAVLARLPELTGKTGDQVEFKIPEEVLPPPRPGETVKEPFPPDASAPAVGVESGPLEVLRYSPEGEVAIAPFLSVTFNQPMVALDTLDSLAAADVPVKIEPSIPGTWRWLGTKTLTFQSDSALFDRLPKATVYKITIPAGTTSVSGKELAKTVTWTFQTPPPKVTNTYPSSQAEPRDPLFFIHFDQRIDPAAVLETIKVTAAGQPVALELASEQSLAADTKITWLLKNAVEGRWIAFRATKTLPADADISVTVGPKTPSAEGPLTTTEAQSYSFRTYAPLRIEEHGCSWGGDPCQPLTPFYIRFNNPLDMTKYQEEMIQIRPALPGASINVVDNQVTISGETKGQTTYTVTVEGSIQDIYGQTLAKTQQLIFHVGPASPLLVGPGQNFITIDPSSKKPGLSVYTINYSRLDVQIYAVQPTDWPAFKQYLRDYQRTDIKVAVPGRLVFDKAVPVESAADELTEVTIDLSGKMDGKFGQFIVIIKPPANLLENKDNNYWQTIQAWVQVTQIGLDAFADHSEMVAWATALKDGAPLSEITITASPSGEQHTTGADGVARFPIPNGTTYLVAKQGADQAILPHDPYYWGDEGWNRRGVSDELRWYVFDDRQMYQPGEEVHLKGWIRRIGGKQDGDVGLVGKGLSGVQYQVIDAQGNQLTAGNARVNALGGFDFSLTLPENMNLGYTQVSLIAQGSIPNAYGQEYYHNIQVQEFRRPEFEVTARNETTGPYFAGGEAILAVKANYYAGGALPNAETTWQVTSSTGQYSPPNWPEFTFGSWTPWWKYSYEFEGRPGYPGAGGTTETFTGKTDGAGEHYLKLNFDQGGDMHPRSIIAQATVMDVNRQAWTGSTSLLVHPAELYVGMRSQPYFVEHGTPIEVDLIVTDLDGNPVGDRPVEVTAARLEWKYSGATWREEAVDTQTCTIGSKDVPVTCTFQTPVGGSYQITATVSDAQGRKNQSQFTRWVSGGKIPPARKVEQEQLTLIPDKETYQPGDTARILVQSPFSPAEGLLTVNRSGLLYTERFTIKDGTATLSIPLKEAYMPNVNIQVDVNGSAPRLDDKGEALADAEPRPAFATGQMTLSIPPVKRELALNVTPEQKELEPGGKTNLNLSLKDSAGNPVANAELAVVVVDESILALTNYQVANPISTFYSNRPADWFSVYARSSILLANPRDVANQAGQAVARESALQNYSYTAKMAEEGAAPAAAPMAMATMTVSMPTADAAGAGQAAAPINVRIDFNPLALFSPEVVTDANGEATVEVKLPDNLTRYRVMVVAVDSTGKQYGMGEANMTARLPLMVRPSAPRFLNFGDQFELPVVLQNQTYEPLVADVVVRGTNLNLDESSAAGKDSAGMRVTIPARDRIEVRFPSSTQLAGTARIQVAAVSGSYADAATIELPVYTPATTEAFATYGVIDEGAIAQPVASPKNVFSQYGGLEITTSSTALQALTDAVLYLVSYPFECSEQLASRVLAVAALRDVLSAFNAQELPSPKEMEAAVVRDLTTLQSMQNGDGGFPYWRRGQESIPYNTIHVAHALIRAREKGFAVPEEMQKPVLNYLTRIESYYPAYYGQNTRWTLSAYAIYVRSLMGDRDPQKALRLIDEAGLENLSLDAVGWLWPVLQDAQGSAARLEEIRRLVNNRVVETAGAANFTNKYDDQNYLLLGSDRRTDAILLDALMIDNPQSDLIVKVVNGLLAHRTAGRWGNTQENVFILLALDHYFNTYESQTPDFVARVWLGSTYAGSHTFSGRTTERSQVDIPMTYLVDPALGGGSTQDLVLSKEGQGRLYYRLGLRYAPSDLKQDPLDMGFVVRRMYEAVDDPADVSQDENGAWHIKAGARVRIHISLVADNRRYHVALVDPTPAGLEAINPALSVSESLPADPTSMSNRSWWWWGPWYQHQNLRDERAEAFTALLWDGVYNYSYIARATTPGTFVVPPAKAEEMYSPEVFGRSASDRVIVE